MPVSVTDIKLKLNSNISGAVCYFQAPKNASDDVMYTKVSTEMLLYCHPLL